MENQAEMQQDEPFPESVIVTGIKIRDCGEVKKARTHDLSLKIGDYVMLQLDGELTYGTVCFPSHRQQFIPPMRVMRSILRKATSQDETAIVQQQQLAKEGLIICRERAEALDLQMKLVEVYGSFQRRLLTFCYTADGRIDFRQLVKDLARHFSCRIEMRQISTREEARRLSGVDTCGLVLCCASFLTDFKPVNLKLSRGEGSWAGDSHRIGVCGRLKCCLMFEQDDWGEAQTANRELIHPTRS